MKVRFVQDADAIFREELEKGGIDVSKGQFFAALTNMRSVGVMGDGRTYDYAVALRGVLTSDFMTAEAAEIPWSVLQTCMTRSSDFRGSWCIASRSRDRGLASASSER